MKRAYLWVLLFVGAGCGVPDKIPCDTDDNCPTVYYCESLNCKDPGPKGPPAPAWRGVQEKGASAVSEQFTLQQGERLELLALIENTGGPDARSVRVQEVQAGCLELSPSFGEDVASGETKPISFRVYAAYDCAPGAVTITTTLEENSAIGGEKVFPGGSFTVTVAVAP